jgi:hypothetical protein
MAAVNLPFEKLTLSGCVILQQYPSEVINNILRSYEVSFIMSYCVVKTDMTINFIMHLFLLQVHCFCLGQWMYLLILQHLIVSVFDYKQMHSCNCVNPRHKYDLL